MTATDMLKPPRVAISISESPDLHVLGVAREHLEDAMAEVARHLLAAGAYLIYGGDLREGGFTEILFELAVRYRRDFESEKATAVATNLLAWPVHAGMPYESLIRLADSLRGTADLDLLTLDGKSMSFRKRAQLAPRQATAEEWSAGLTAMRQVMTGRSVARIVLGGRVEKFKGAIPGVAEECLIALHAHQPLFLLGGFGGCAQDVACDLGLVHSSGVVSGRTWPGRETFAQFTAEDLNNGLTPTENSTLADTIHIDQAVPLILTGLLRKNVLAVS